jgi:hypothetical protein
MSESLAFRRFAATTQKLRDLIERRGTHLIDLQSSGRWRRYCSEAEFDALMADGLRLAEVWRRLAPRQEDQQAAEQGLAALRDILTRADTPRRSAA